MREIQDAWTAGKAAEIQGNADRNKWKSFFSAIKAVCGPPTKGTAPLLSADGVTLLSEKTQILQGAVQQLSSGKARGSDAIPAEVYKHDGLQLIDHLTAFFQEIWRQGEFSQNFKDTTIVHLYKRKANGQLCDNHRGISLHDIARKIFPRILLNLLNNHLEQGFLPEGQCGFRRHRGILDMIFIAR
nr:unnamed protein product [Spirometra erinaceieuropaei]